MSHPIARLRAVQQRLYPISHRQLSKDLLLSGLTLLLMLTTACFKRGVTPIRTHFNQGVYHYSHGNYQAAIGEYRLAIEENANDHRAQFNLAEALEAQATQLEREGQTETAEDRRLEAEDVYRALLAKDPNHLRAAVNMAAREFQLGDHAAAEARLRSTLEHHPRSALPRVALAAHYFRRREPESIRAAITVLEEAIERDRSNPDANVLLGHAYAALERRGQTAIEGSSSTASSSNLADRAREAYERVLHQVPGDVGALMGLARLERRVGDLDRAESYARRALYVVPDLLTGHLLLADLLEARNELEDATAHLWRARQLEGGARHPQLSPDEYRQRLLELYRRLAEQEGAELAWP